MAKKMTNTEKAKKARDAASGTKKIPMDKKESFAKALKREVLEGKSPSVSREVKVLAKQGRVNSQSVDYNNNVTVKKVDSDAYRILSNLAKGKALKGAEAENAINKAYKGMRNRMQNDRDRTASRAEFIAKRESNKRSNTNLG